MAEKPTFDRVDNLSGLQAPKVNDLGSSVSVLGVNNLADRPGLLAPSDASTKTGDEEKK
ncbi:hypothetical protein OIE68_02340 [Nocardia vinacea]|uniref:Uncharacterized protein n=1 Tax=Nocardia vinacea TaxID=96468 RepID=A0ABZ1YRF9_9NOCA|nr:hypothetical protein OIE68_02340 [Nocardia vinacea]